MENYQIHIDALGLDFFCSRGHRASVTFTGLAADPEGRAGFELGVTGPPETFIVDADGIIRARWRGAVTDIVWIQRMAGPWAAAGGQPIDWSAAE